VSAHVAVTAELVRQTTGLEQQLEASFAQHPSAEILRSLPGLGVVPGTAPITRAPGKSRGMLANRLVGILPGCLHHGSAYDEATARPRRNVTQPRSTIACLIGTVASSSRNASARALLPWTRMAKSSISPRRAKPLDR
jgi:hypothetical protein